MKLYRGSRQSVRILAPQPIPEGDRRRFPQGIDSAIIATDDSTEAQIYAVFSRRDAGPFQFGKDEKGKWHVMSPVTAKKLKQWAGEHFYLYEVSDEDARAFKRPLAGDEYYSTISVVPSRKTQLTVKQVVQEWEIDGKVEIHYQTESEVQRLKG